MGWVGIQGWCKHPRRMLECPGRRLVLCHRTLVPRRFRRFRRSAQTGSVGENSAGARLGHAAGRWAAEAILGEWQGAGPSLLDTRDFCEQNGNSVGTETGIVCGGELLSRQNFCTSPFNPYHWSAELQRRMRACVCVWHQSCPDSAVSPMAVAIGTSHGRLRRAFRRELRRVPDPKYSLVRTPGG